MNRVLIGLDAFLVIVVAFLFYKVYSREGDSQTSSEQKKDSITTEQEVPKAVKQIASAPTGKIAYVNIDRLNEESLEITDLITETKRRRDNIEGNVESLSLKYQNKVEEFQLLQKGGIAPKSELEAKAREIQAIEKEAQNKQLQMDQLSVDINDKNSNFQKRVRDFLITWNNGRYDYIFSYSEAVPTMLLGNTSLEITEEVIKEINNEYKQRKQSKAK